MAAFRDDMPLVAGVNEDWDEHTTGTQIMRPDWDFSPIRMRTMHHLPQIFFDTLRPERPDCPVLIPSSFSRARDRVISQDIYSYEPCGLPTGNFMPAEQAQMRLMTASPITLRACIPAPDQVTPEQAYFKDLDFYKKTLFHTPFLSRGRAVTLLEYRDAKIVFEVDDWFKLLPQAVQRYLLPLQSMYAKWYDQNVPDLTQNYSYCTLCKNKQTNLQRHHMQHHARWRTIWFCPIPGCPSSLANKEGLVKHLQSRPHGRGIELKLGRKVAKEIANQNCFWPVTQVMADKLLCASKRLIRYIALYSMAGVAMENRLFRIHPNARDTPFMDACAAFLTPKMSLSQVMPSGCHLCRFAQPPANQLAVADRPSASDYLEVEEFINPEDMRVAVTTPVFQPYRGETGRAWMAKEYGVTMDTSSLMSSETEREDTDDEVCSFDLGPEPFGTSQQARLPSDEWLDDHQQGLQPGSSEPRPDPYDRYLPMPIQPSILDMIRSDVENNEPEPAPTTERAPTPMIRWDFDYVRDEPPVVQRIAEEPRHSTPRADPKTPSESPRPALELPRPRASSAPPTSHPAKRMALNYLPVTEEITPPITPPRAQRKELDTATEVVPETPPPATKPGRSRGRGTWCAQQKTAPEVGTRSRTKLAELEKRENAQAQAAHARWPPSPDITENIQELTRELKLCDVPRNVHKELERVLPSGEEDMIQTPRQPPAAGLMTRHQDTFFIPPPRAVGGVRGKSAPVSTATLGLIHRQDPSLAAQLREDPGSMMTQATRRRVYSTMRLIRTGMLGQLASLQQWEEAMHRQDDM